MLLGVSKTLKQYLVSAIPNPGDWVEIGLFQQDNPPTLPGNGHLVLFLYAVEENPHLRNRPLEPGEDGIYRVPPLALTLHYLVTYMTKNASDLQDWLARVVQAFHTKPRLGPGELDPSIAGEVAELAVRLQSVSPDEVQKLWTALAIGMRLSLYYAVDAALVPSLERRGAPPVLERTIAGAA
jgi:Pvc16 N-terminal domain